MSNAYNYLLNRTINHLADVAWRNEMIRFYTPEPASPAKSRATKAKRNKRRTTQASRKANR